MSHSVQCWAYTAYTSVSSRRINAKFFSQGIPYCFQSGGVVDERIWITHLTPQSEEKVFPNMSVTERTKGMIWKMSQRPTFNRFETKAESSRNFMKVQSTFAFRICHSPPQLCSLEDFTSRHRFRLLYAGCVALPPGLLGVWGEFKPKGGSLCCERFQWFHGRFHLL